MPFKTGFYDKHGDSIYTTDKIRIEGVDGEQTVTHNYLGFWDYGYYPDGNTEFQHCSHCTKFVSFAHSPQLKWVDSKSDLIEDATNDKYRAGTHILRTLDDGTTLGYSKESYYKLCMIEEEGIDDERN